METLFYIVLSDRTTLNVFSNTIINNNKYDHRLENTNDTHRDLNDVYLSLIHICITNHYEVRDRSVSYTHLIWKY